MHYYYNIYYSDMIAYNNDMVMLCIAPHVISIYIIIIIMILIFT